MVRQLISRLNANPIHRKAILLLSGCLGSFILSAMPVMAEITDTDIAAFVEALRLAAPDTGTEDDGLYSDWQIKPDNIPRWSRLCTGEELTPAQFEANTTKAREILACVMGDILKEEYQASGENEALAVRRAAAWWMAGDPNQYDSERIDDYTQEVLRYYQQQ